MRVERIARLRVVPGTGDDTDLPAADDRLVEPPRPDDAPARPDAGDDVGLWHVAVTYAGPAVAADDLAGALRRLADERPFLGSARYAADRVELSYWDEAAELQDAAALALRLFIDHRRSTGLPDWRVVALEVMDRDTLRAGGRRDDPSPAFGLDDVRPMV